MAVALPFHPAVSAWFEREFGSPTEPQRSAWPAIMAGDHTLISAPTGSGKTLAAFLAVIDRLVREGVGEGELPAQTRVLYLSPLKALSNDIARNLQAPLAGIAAELERQGFPHVDIRTRLRTGDTDAKSRAALGKAPPHIFVTTPESLYIMLTSEGGRRMLRTVQTVIVDEIHAVVGDKRGSHLALSLERLRSLCGGKLQRIGLSATQKPIERVAEFLVGTPDEPCTIVDAGHARPMDLSLELPASPLSAVMSNEVWEELFDRMVALIREHQTTLVFVNTRRMSERVARHLGERLGNDAVTSHHGSLSREQRLEAESRLKSGKLRALVATASLELGIDVGAVDLVCQVGSPRSIAASMQRIGRSGHHLRGLPKGRLFPTTRDDLVECASLLMAIAQKDLETLRIPDSPLDILAQQLVAAVAAEDWQEEALFALTVRAYPYRNLTRDVFRQVLHMLTEGYTGRRGRRGAFIHFDAVYGTLRARKGARLTAITCGGAIPDNADFQVVLEPEGTVIGTLNEDFAIESSAGDIFQLGNTAWRILRVEPGTVRVMDAQGQPPNLPFWLGEAPARTPELSDWVSRLREGIEGLTREQAQVWLGQALPTLPLSAHQQLAEYLVTSALAFGALPTTKRLVLERFFDESGGQQLIVHSPLGGRINRALGLALRKSFCRAFDFELQAAATDDAVILSLGPTHSFPLEDVAKFLRSPTVRNVLIQALLAAPVFATRWRWNVTRALAVPRFSGGRRVPPRFMRMGADDLLSLVFPTQVACAENLPGGDRDIPDHPLVNQTIHDCLTEAMDVDGLVELVRNIESGRVEVLSRDLTEPSPLAQEILSARPYAFLDDAPLEERRTQAVYARRWMDDETARDLGALDADAVARVRAEAWPEWRNMEELHDALLQLGFLLPDEMKGDLRAFEALVGAGRALRFCVPTGQDFFIAAEKLAEMEVLFPDGSARPPLLQAPQPLVPAGTEALDRLHVLKELLRARLEAIGPVAVSVLTLSIGAAADDVLQGIVALEVEGFIFRGRFTPGAVEEEVCERRLLARIHRYTIDRLRKEIEAVPAAEFYRFLIAWHGASQHTKRQGPAGLERTLSQLEGFEAAASAWEEDLLPLRMESYETAWMDASFLAGRFVWGRANPAALGAGTQGPIRTTPIRLSTRANAGVFFANVPEASCGPEAVEVAMSSAAKTILARLELQGASFFDDLCRWRDGSGKRVNMAADAADGTASSRGSVDQTLMASQVEGGLAELVNAGRVHSDSFAGLRALLFTRNERTKRPGRVRESTILHNASMANAGRWTLLQRGIADSQSQLEITARALLIRYGVVFKRVLERESGLPPWRDLLRTFRTMEARGEIRGGRFVAGFSGEQFALVDAVASLRSLRRQDPEDDWVVVSGSDPLNLVGILTPEERLPAQPGNRLLLRRGIPVAVREGNAIRFLQPAAAFDGSPDSRALQNRMEAALIRRTSRHPQTASQSENLSTSESLDSALLNSDLLGAGG
jgi:ATP-dependent Lhr-like helicase